MTDPTQARRIIGILALTQVLSWGTVYYAFSVLAPYIQREMHWRAEVVYGAFSWSLLVAGLVSTPVGVLLDRHGGRWVMGFGSLVAGAGLIMLGLATSVMLYFVAWSVIGVGMALVLYEAAFATINREFLTDARKGISTLTLFGGLASTVNGDRRTTGRIDRPPCRWPEESAKWRLPAELDLKRSARSRSPCFPQPSVRWPCSGC